MVPPRRLTEAASVAGVGGPVLRRLPRSLRDLSEAEAKAVVRTGALIGGTDALSGCPS
ncbi:hypothetical protein [Streptomyces sp. NPDC056387]|uniref:hypothetical protein n=1 Tax=Streptomyces sp. NPDC056387 TaxID=3345803 RepID=UPI0035E0173A